MTPPSAEPPARRRTVVANGVAFACLEAGPAGGPLALCLHGFPDTAHTWRHLLPDLGAAGFHAVAPFQRGYAPTEVPADGRYQVGALARDAACLHESLGGGPDAVLVGHDWGAMAAYAAAAHRPGQWRRVVTMAVPPLPALAAGFLTYDQLRRSWYQFFFRLPMAEPAVAAGDLTFLARLWGEWSPGYDATWDMARVRESLGGHEHLSAALGYYRALFDPGQHDQGLDAEQAAASAPVPQPTLYLHGRRDGCIGVDAIGDPLSCLGPGSAVAILPDAGHFLHLERPAEVSDRVLAFLSAGSAGDSAGDSTGDSTGDPTGGH